MERIELNFGLVIAYIVPGLIGLYSLAPHSQAIRTLLGGNNYSLSAQALVPLLLLAIAAGIIINAVSGIILKPMIIISGVEEIDPDYSRLKSKDIEKFKEFTNQTYRYYQCYSNMLIALIMFFISYRCKITGIKLGFIVLLTIPILFCAARSSLKQSYKVMSDLIPSNGGENNGLRNGTPEDEG